MKSVLDHCKCTKITEFLEIYINISDAIMNWSTGLLCRGYCAPEYLRQGRMSFKSDMYSLGVLIIELVTGQKAPPNKNNNVRQFDLAMPAISF